MTLVVTLHMAIFYMFKPVFFSSLLCDAKVESVVLSGSSGGVSGFSSSLLKNLTNADFCPLLPSF